MNILNKVCGLTNSIDIFADKQMDYGLNPFGQQIYILFSKNLVMLATGIQPPIRNTSKDSF